MAPNGTSALNNGRTFARKRRTYGSVCPHCIPSVLLIASIQDHSGEYSRCYQALDPVRRSDPAALDYSTLAPIFRLFSS
jgi:hypothetical protein